MQCIRCSHEAHPSGSCGDVGYNGDGAPIWCECTFNHPLNCLICSLHPPRGLIDKWRVIENNYAIDGFIFGHPYFADGNPIFTSRVEYFDELHARTRNSNYILGEKQCPRP